MALDELESSGGRDREVAALADAIYSDESWPQAKDKAVDGASRASFGVLGLMGAWARLECT